METNGKGSLTEKQKKVNLILFQILCTVLILIYSLVFISLLELLAAWLFGVVIKADISIMTIVTPIVMFLGIILSWIVNRIVSRAIVRRFLQDKLSAEVVEFYLSKKKK